MPHHHDHDHGTAHYGRAFAIGSGLNLAFVALELVAGGLAHSLALISDAAHNFSDVFALLLAWGASVLVRRQATTHYTYGLRRSSILAALINAVLLLFVTGGVAWEAIRRLADPQAVNGGAISGIAAIGILVNSATALLFMSGRKDDLNLRGAFQHMAADAVVALGVVIAGGLIALSGWQWLDPAISLVISGFILISTWGLLRQSLDLALDAVPEGIDSREVERYLTHLPGVTSVHDLHIWGMSTTETAMTAHLVMRDPASSDVFLSNASQGLHDTFGIEHATLQRETGELDNPCLGCPPLKVGKS